MMYMKVTMFLKMTNISDLFPFDVIQASISPTNPSKASGSITLYHQETAQILQSVNYDHFPHCKIIPKELKAKVERVKESIPCENKFTG